MLIAHPKIHVNIQNIWGNTALISATEGSHKEMVDSLLQHPQIDVNSTDNNGDTALMIAARH
jgi:ankyrin repeat protein